MSASVTQGGHKNREYRTFYRGTVTCPWNSAK